MVSGFILSYDKITFLDIFLVHTVHYLVHLTLIEVFKKVIISKCRFNQVFGAKTKINYSLN